MSNKRVLVLNHFAVPRDQPGGTRHVELFGRLDGWSATIIASRLNLTTGKRQAPQTGFVLVPVTPYRSNGLTRVANWVSFAVTATWASFRQPRPDVVYGSSPHLLAGLAAWFVARVRRAPFILEIRDLWPRVLADMNHMSETSPIYRLLQRLERFLYDRADRIVVLATGSADVLREMGIPDAKVAYIPNGADPEDFVPSAPRDSLRARYRFDRLTFVYAGAHGPANGLDLLLDAAANTEGDYEIVLVGAGVDKERLVRRAESERLSRVRFMDPVPKTEVADVLGAADVGLHVLAEVDLFRYGVSPNKVFDYMAAGLPILTNTQGLVADLIQEGGAGLAVEPGALSEGLRRLVVAEPQERLAYGKSGSSWLSKNQSRRAMRDRVRLLLDQVSQGR